METKDLDSMNLRTSSEGYTDKEQWIDMEDVCINLMVLLKKLQIFGPIGMDVNAAYIMTQYQDDMIRLWLNIYGKNKL
jgi:hypothetical protein